MKTFVAEYYVVIIDNIFGVIYLLGSTFVCPQEDL